VGFRVWGLVLGIEGFGLQPAMSGGGCVTLKQCVNRGIGIRVHVVGIRDYRLAISEGIGFGVQGSGFKIQGLELRLEFRVEG